MGLDGGDYHPHHAVRSHLHLNGLIHGQRRPLQPLPPHREPRHLQRTIGFRKQFPHSLLKHCGVVGHMHQLGGQHFALLIQNLVSLACQFQRLAHAEQIAVRGGNT